MIVALVFAALVVVGGGATAAILLVGGDDDEEVCASGARVAGCVPPEEPSDDPTGGPTAAPTDGPTGEPTGEPTEEPTGEPTEEPTGEPGGSDPATAVQGFLDASVAGDCQTAIGYLSESAIEEWDANCKNFDSGSLAKADLGSPEVLSQDDETARVEVTISVSGHETSIIFEMVADGDRWRIDDTTTESTGTPTP